MPYPKNYSGNCSSNCGRPATRWVDYEKFGEKRFASFPYCDVCGTSYRGAGVTTRPLKRLS